MRFVKSTIVVIIIIGKMGGMISGSGSKKGDEVDQCLLVVAGMINLNCLIR